MKKSTPTEVAFIVFPGNGPIRPYAGIGAAINWVEGTKENQNPNCTPLGQPGTGLPCSTGLAPQAFWFPTKSGSQYRDDAADFIDPLLILGVQIQVSRVSLFGQAKV